MSMHSFHARQRKTISSTAARRNQEQTPAALLAPNPAQWRADALLVRQGLAASRAEARAMILAGKVSFAGVPIRKASRLLPLDAQLRCESS
ncbi:MAG: hypothetical protein LBG69_07100 [Zoogloeaceae bacterium]|jgi:23S rRNA (cytidine1920-2'-O)/16S rRNA (cytidine1409-2'-O)-methyltransferase|nr:hypothetical protein [Zoogloeaceae bacterium]